MSVVLVGTSLYGCISISPRFVTGLTAEERALAAELPVHEHALDDGTYEALGPVRGLSCQINKADAFRASREHALEELKRATFRDGGNAAMNLRCETFSRGQGRSNCFRSVECSAEAVRIHSTSEQPGATPPPRILRSND